MNTQLLPPLRAHEWLFGGFLLLTTARLLATGGATALGLAFLTMALTIVAVAAIARRWPSPLTVRLRLAQFLLLVNLAYSQLGPAVRHLGMRPWDSTLLGLDRALTHETPSLLLAAWCPPLLTDALSGCYMLFFPAVLTAFVVAMILPEPRSGRLFNGLISIYALGFLGYTLIPAAGPHLVMPDAFPSTLTGGLLTRANAAMVAGGSNHVDVFPSLHTAVTVFLMACLWQRHRTWFLILLLPAVGICAATLYLRYHYAVDVLAGLILAVVGLILSRIPTTSHEPHTAFP